MIKTISITKATLSTIFLTILFALILDAQQDQLRRKGAHEINERYKDSPAIACKVSAWLSELSLDEILNDEFQIDYRILPKADIKLSGNQYIIIDKQNFSESIWIDGDIYYINIDSGCIVLEPGAVKPKT